MSDSMWWWFLAIAVLINLGITHSLWQESRRGPKRKFLRNLQDGKPITPKHNPASLSGNEVCLRDEDKQFFADFRKCGYPAARRSLIISAIRSSIT
jgi:hypothetical protein